jgi:hyperosmotically inducible periplasmic protein
MRAFIVGLILGIVLCFAGIWYFGNHTMRVDADHASTSLKNDATETKDYVKEKADSLNLNTGNIKDEMSHVGAVIRRKASDAGHAIADAASDTKITATIKGKLVADPNLSALSISVSTTDGFVTMSGTASSPENIQKAIQLAWDTDGVTGVASTIQVKQ